MHPMVELTFVGSGDGAWPDMADKEVIHVSGIKVAGLSDGTVGGDPSVALRIDLPDGRVVFAESSLRLWLTVADALRMQFGDPR